MASFFSRWNESFKVFYDKLDDEHKGLFDGVFTMNEKRGDAAAIADLLAVRKFVLFVFVLLYSRIRQHPRKWDDPLFLNVSLLETVTMAALGALKKPFLS